MSDFDNFLAFQVIPRKNELNFRNCQNIPEQKNPHSFFLNLFTLMLFCLFNKSINYWLTRILIDWFILFLCSSEAPWQCPLERTSQFTKAKRPNGMPSNGPPAKKSPGSRRKKTVMVFWVTSFCFRMLMVGWMDGWLVGFFWLVGWLGKADFFQNMRFFINRFFEGQSWETSLCWVEVGFSTCIPTQKQTQVQYMELYCIAHLFCMCHLF